MPRTREGYVFYWEERKRWYARVTWTDGSGKRRQAFRAVENRTEGKRVLKEMLRSLEGNEARALEGHKLTFGKVAKLYADRRLIPAEYQGETKVRGMRSWRNQRGYLKTLLSHFSNKRIQAMTWGDIEDYRQTRLSQTTRLQKLRSVTMVNRELSLLRTILNYAVREGWLTRNPFEAGDALIRHADEVKRDRVLTEDEESRLLSQCVGARAHLRAMVICAVDTGLRRSEQFSLTWQDVDFVEGVIRVRSTTTKTRKARLIGLTERLRAELLPLRELAKDFSERIFPQVDAKKAFNTACRLAGIENLRWHDLRHTTTTRMVEAGLPAQQIMKITGHTQMSTFLRYVTADEDAARRSAAALDERAQRRMNEELNSSVNEFVN